MLQFGLFAKEAEMKYSNEQLNAIHLKTVASVERLKACEADLLLNLQKVRESRAYEFMGYKNVYLYAVHALKLSEGQAYAFTAVAKVAAHLPDLQSAIIDGDVSISMAKRVLPVINETNEEKWVHDLKTKTKREIEKEVAKENPRAAVPEQARYVSEKIIELKVGFSEENFEILKRSQELCAQKLGRMVSLEETIVHLGREFNGKADPVKKAERAHERAVRKKDGKVQLESEILCPGLKTENTVVKSTSPKPRPKPAVVYHAVNLRDKGRCQAKMPNGKTCGDAKWIDVHHVIEVANGGPTTPENLITLCRAHHRMWHDHSGGTNRIRDRQKQYCA
jgi:hypothetical protein